MNLEDVHSIILAGGLGTRLRGILGDVPKPMARVQGRPFLEWIARWLAGCGIRTAEVDCVAEDRALGTAG
jgi:NDP-sugar pyrophosphorylase family protein